MCSNKNYRQNELNYIIYFLFIFWLTEITSRNSLINLVTEFLLCSSYYFTKYLESYHFPWLQNWFYSYEVLFNKSRKAQRNEGREWLGSDLEMKIEAITNKEQEQRESQLEYIGKRITTLSAEYKRWIRKSEAYMIE